MEDAPIQSYAILRKFLPKAMQPYLRGIRKRFGRPKLLPQPYRAVFPYTQVHLFRQENLVRLSREIENVPGAIVECGVLDGGTAALMAASTKDRPVHLFDSWEGLPKTSEKDGNAGMWSGEVVGSPRRVVSAFNALGVDMRRVHFHKGWFDRTFAKAVIPQIALLHIDADFYESVLLSLETWAPKVSKGGYVQIDDYSSFIGCKKATDEFLARHPEMKLLSFKEIAFYLKVD